MSKRIKSSSGKAFLSSARYRMQSDLIVQRIIQSGAEGVNRYEICDYVGVNANSKRALAGVSEKLQLLVKDSSHQIGQYQKMDGKVRVTK
jgi:hypothetical protein